MRTYCPSKANLSVPNLASRQNTRITLHSTLLQCCTCLYCASIASAGGFERNRLRTDLATAMLVASLLYPLPVHWCWHEQGFLAKRYSYSYHHETRATRLPA